MKIAFLTLYSGFVDRGVETFVKEVGNRLANDHEVVVFQAGPPRGTEAYQVRQINLDIDWGRKDMTKTLGRLFFLDYWSRLIFLFTIRCWSLLWKGQFDVIVPTDGGWEKPICWLLKILKGTKILVTGQSGPGYDDRWNLFWWPDVFVALTSKAEKWAKSVSGVKVVKIPNGVDLEKFSPKVEPLKIDLPKPIIICASALTPSKRIDLTIQAVAKLQDVSLLVVGDGDQKEYLENLGEKLLGKRFALRSVKYEEMPQVYRSADLFTMVSASSEAFGIVYVEAMASGLPVVVTDDEIRHEIVDEAGLFVDPTNIESYVETLKKALKTDWDDKPRKQAEKFSWNKIAKKYEVVMKNFPGVPA